MFLIYVDIICKNVPVFLACAANVFRIYTVCVCSSSLFGILTFVINQKHDMSKGFVCVGFFCIFDGTKNIIFKSGYICVSQNKTLFN